MNFAIPGLPKKMNLTIGVRSRRRVVPGVQVWVFWVRIRWRVRISVRFGRVGSEYRVDGLDPRFQSGAVTRDCGHLALFSAQIWNLRQILGHVGYFWSCSGIFGRTYGSISVWPGQTHQIGPDPNIPKIRLKPKLSRNLGRWVPEHTQKYLI